MANPMTGKADRNLDAARMMIDTLEMLEEKTAGNLTPDESRMLKSSLTDLRIMFVDESKIPDQPKVEEPKPAVTEDPKVKFHKGYGEE
jgi:Domain of unknown function (DUF1844)